MPSAGEKTSIKGLADINGNKRAPKSSGSVKIFVLLFTDQSQIMEIQSYSAWPWLEWIALKENKEIHHALNYGEMKLGKYKVDGFDGSTIYEFLWGCSYHGCKNASKIGIAACQMN